MEKVEIRNDASNQGRRGQQNAATRRPRRISRGYGSFDEAGKFLEANPFGLAVVASSEAKGDSDKLRVLTAAR